MTSAMLRWPGSGKWGWNRSFAGLGGPTRQLCSSSGMAGHRVPRSDLRPSRLGPGDQARGDERRDGSCRLDQPAVRVGIELLQIVAEMLGEQLLAHAGLDQLVVARHQPADHNVVEINRDLAVLDQ